MSLSYHHQEYYTISFGIRNIFFELRNVIFFLQFYDCLAALITIYYKKILEVLMACMYPSPSTAPDVLYPYIKNELVKLMENEPNWISNAANAASTLGFLMPQLNWAGFYLAEGDTLVLGPFWGRPAVTRIAIGKGVCGDSALAQKTIVVPDVHQYPGHIACDVFSNSEIVIPIVKNGKLIGVLDIDSPETDRFKEEDRIGLEEIVELLIRFIQFPIVD